MTPPHRPLPFVAALTLALALALVVHVRAADDPPASPPRVRLEMWLDWKANAQFAGLLVAKENGWYAGAGLDVTIHPNGEAENVNVADAVAADPAHALGSLEGRGVVGARGRGVSIRAVATMFQVSPFALICRPSAGIRAARDLAGKTVGIRHPGDRKMLEVLCEHAGLKPADVGRTKPVGFDLKEFEAGEVDAVFGYLVDELVQLRLRGVEVNALPLHEHGWTEYAQVIVANDKLLQTDPEAVRRFVAVTFRGWQAAVDDPGAAARMIVEKYPPGLDAAEQEAAIRAMAPLLTAESLKMGAMRRETWERMLGMFRQYGLADAKVGGDEIADFRFTP